jgi:hypothetical protein
MYHLIFVYTYLLLGVYLTIRKVNINPLYLLCLSFVSFKVIFEYRVCSVAYMECRLRDVKREESYMNKFLDPIVDLRYTDHIYPLTMISFLILTYHLIILEKYNIVYNLFKV